MNTGSAAKGNPPLENNLRTGGIRALARGPVNIRGGAEGPL